MRKIRPRRSNTTGSFILRKSIRVSLGSVGQVEPDHQRQLDDDEDESDGEQVPISAVLDEVAVLEQHQRRNGTDDAGDAGGATTVRQKTFVDLLAEDLHRFFSNLKISSVGTPKTRANSSARGRLGT